MEFREPATSMSYKIWKIYVILFTELLQCCWLKVVTVIKWQRKHGRQGDRILSEDRCNL
jgi:hypothetical protein